MLILGKLIYGFSSGLYTTIVPKMIEEIIPTHLFPSFTASFVLAIEFAILVSYLLGGILPEDSDTEALKKTNLWLIHYLYLPVGMQLLSLLSLFFVIKYEPIKYLIKTDRIEEA